MPDTEPLLAQLRPFLQDEDAFGKLHADLHDMAQICAWFLKIVGSASAKQLSRDEVEGLLIDLDVNLVDHASFHLKSFKEGIALALQQISLRESAEQEYRGGD